ncbi:unnamed protein product [Gordionus sp. m RMFG-2023]
MPSLSDNDIKSKDSKAEKNKRSPISYHITNIKFVNICDPDISKLDQHYSGRSKIRGDRAIKKSPKDNFAKEQNKEEQLHTLQDYSNVSLISSIPISNNQLEKGQKLSFIIAKYENQQNLLSKKNSHTSGIKPLLSVKHSPNITKTVIKHNCHLNKKSTARVHRKYLHLYNTLSSTDEGSTVNHGRRFKSLLFGFWSPLIIISVFGILVMSIALLEILMLHYAQRHSLGAKLRRRGDKEFMRGGWRTGNSDYQYYYEGDGDDANGIDRKRYVYNYVNYNYDPTHSASYREEFFNEGDKSKADISNEVQRKWKDLSEFDSKYDSHSFVEAKKIHKIPIFVGLERKNLDDNQSAHNLPMSERGEVEIYDDSFIKVKNLLLNFNKIPKYMPRLKSIENTILPLKYLSSGRIGKLQMSTNNPLTINGHKKNIYLNGQGAVYKKDNPNGMVQEKTIFYSPFQNSFDVLSLLPKGLRPSIYYNYLLMHQSLNEKRFREIILSQSQLFIKNNKRLKTSMHLGYHDHSIIKNQFIPKSLNSSIKFAHPNKFNIPDYGSVNIKNSKILCNFISDYLIKSKTGGYNAKTKRIGNKTYVQINSNITFYKKPSLSLRNTEFIKIETFKGPISWAKLKSFLPSVKQGGHWKPQKCISRHKLAIIIPYRDREEHLYKLLASLHSLLKRQEIFYKIYVVEQYGSGLFNKAILMNAAFREAFWEKNFHCYVFHDVDLMPEDYRNMYSCPKQPRHLSVAIDEMDYKLKYQMLVGGVLMFKPEHFIKVNGYSNLYWGWGAEDDDMAYR